MLIPDLRDPDAILAFLSPSITAIHDALDQGASLADDFFLSRKKKRDNQLWSYLVRYGACEWLDGIPDALWTRRSLSLSGIQIAQVNLSVRVLKSRDGEVPPPGPSFSKQGYYLQQLQTTLDVGVPETRSNLILDWQMNQQRQLACYLSKPMGLWNFPDAPRLEWRRALVLPSAGGLPRFVGADEADLPIALVIDPSEYKVAGGRL